MNDGQASLPDFGEMRQLPRISIVTPSYNQGQYLEETICSVISQGYPNLQYIIIDGKSKDQSIDIICRYAKHLDCFCVAPDAGQTDALNRGFAYANGDLLGFVNSDDLLAPGALWRIARAAASAPQGLDHPTIIAGQVEHFSETDTSRSIADNNQFGNFGQWIAGSAALQQPGTFWSASLWRMVGPFRRDMHYAFDKYFFAATAAVAPQFLHIPSVVARFRVHPLSKTSEGVAPFLREWENAVPGLVSAAPHRARQLAARDIRDWYALKSANTILSKSTRSSAIVSIVQSLLTRPSIVLARPFWGAVRRVLLG